MDIVAKIQNLVIGKPIYYRLAEVLALINEVKQIEGAVYNYGNTRNCESFSVVVHGIVISMNLYSGLIRHIAVTFMFGNQVITYEDNNESICKMNRDSYSYNYYTISDTVKAEILAQIAVTPFKIPLFSTNSITHVTGRTNQYIVKQ